jgi:hypothetical protein
LRQEVCHVKICYIQIGFFFCAAKLHEKFILQTKDAIFNDSFTCHSLKKGAGYDAVFTVHRFISTVLKPPRVPRPVSLLRFLLFLANPFQDMTTAILKAGNFTVFHSLIIMFGCIYFFSVFFHGRKVEKSLLGFSSTEESLKNRRRSFLQVEKA